MSEITMFSKATMKAYGFDNEVFDLTIESNKAIIVFMRWLSKLSQGDSSVNKDNAKGYSYNLLHWLTEHGISEDMSNDLVECVMPYFNIIEKMLKEKGKIDSKKYATISYFCYLHKSKKSNLLQKLKIHLSLSSTERKVKRLVDTHTLKHTNNNTIKTNLQYTLETKLATVNVQVMSNSSTVTVSIDGSVVELPEEDVKRHGLLSALSYHRRHSKLPKAQQELAASALYYLSLLKNKLSK